MNSRFLLGLLALGGLATVFWPEDPSGAGPPDPPPDMPVLRANALALCASYLPCTRGDAHYREICKDYGGIGTTCGYLPAWMFWRLGCRDPRLVNREEPADGLRYRIGANIAAVVQGGRAIGAFRFWKAGDAPPKPADVLYFGVVGTAGGISHEHVAVCADCDIAGGILSTYDLGHSIQPEGSFTQRRIDAAGNVGFLGSTRRLIGVLDVALVPFTAPADLSDHTLGVA